MNILLPVAARLGVEYEHPEHRRMNKVWRAVRDCLLKRVKEQGLVYLPHPTPEYLKSSDPKIRQAAERRYVSYNKRAVHVPMCRRTRSGLIGQVNQRPPLVKLPEQLELYKRQMSIRGYSLYSLATLVVGELTSMGRCALVADFSATMERPFVEIVAAEDIITWAGFDGKKVTAATPLRMIMYRQAYDRLSADMTVVEQHTRLVHMAMINDVAHVRVRTLENMWGEWLPVLVNGAKVDRLPAIVLGAEVNDVDVETPPMAELAEIEIAHYRNSADYEEMVHVAGQATPVFTGLTEDWYNNVLKGTVRFGTYGGIPLPKDADAKFLQIVPNGVAAEAIKQKEAMARAVGAQLIEERQIRRTAAEVGIEAAANHSTLSLAAHNTEEGLNYALRFSAMFVGAPEDSVSFKFNADYSGGASSVEARRTVVEEYLKGAISWTELRDSLRQGNPHVTMDDDAVKKEIEDAQEAKRVALMEQSSYNPDGSPKQPKPEGDPNAKT